MPDIQLRFHRDMLVLAAPVDAMLAKQGIDAARDRQYLNLMEPDSIRDAFRLEGMAGAHCMVTTTEDITQARLAHLRMDADAARLAHAAVSIASEVKPQHILVEVGPCGLPLDASSKASLNENRSQYANAARLFDNEEFDAFFLNGFASIADLKCALMGVAQVSDRPVFASVTIGDASRAREEAIPDMSELETGSAVIDLPFGGYSLIEDANGSSVPTLARTGLAAERWSEAIDTMVDLGASVVGFETAEPLEQALGYARVAAERTDRPILTQLCVTGGSVKGAATGLTPLSDLDEYTPDTMTTAAVKLYGAGVQFLRATGQATPAYTGSLAATVLGLDARR